MLAEANALLAGTPLAWVAGEVGWRTAFAWGAGVVAVAALAIVLGTRNAPVGQVWRNSSAGGAGFDAILRDLRFWRIAFLNFATVGSVLAVQGLWGGPYLADVYGLAELQVGNALVALGVGAITGNLTCGWLSDRFGRGVVLLTGASVFFSTQVLLALALPVVPVVVLYLVFGLFGSYFVVLIAEVRSIFPAALTGRAITGVNFFGMTGAMVVQSLMGLLIASGGVGSFSGYTVAFLMTASLGALALALFEPVARASSSEGIRQAQA